MRGSITAVCVWATALLSFASANVVQDPLAISLIKNVINLFPLLLDSRRFDIFDQAFTEDAQANFHMPSGQIFQGLPDIVNNLDGLVNITASHGLTTQYVNMTSPTTANATAYMYANFFGFGGKAGEIYTAYGIYTFPVVLTANGWRINYIDLVLIHDSGNEYILFEN